MPNENPPQQEFQDSGLESLNALPIVAAVEFADWGIATEGAEATPGLAASSPFESDREYRLCKSIIEHPLEPSSRYPKWAGMSAKTAISIRQSLVAKGFVREHQIQSGGRGRSTLLLEALPPGIEAIAQHEGPEIGAS